MRNCRSTGGTAHQRSGASEYRSLVTAIAALKKGFMSWRFGIETTHSGLLMWTERDTPLWQKLLPAAMAGCLVWMITSGFAQWRWRLVFSCAATIIVFLALMRPNRAELRVTKFEFVFRRNFGRRYRSQVIHTADVQRLEFRHSGGLTQNRDLTTDLCAVKDRGSVCLLPNLRYSDTQEVIAAVTGRFPVLAERWRKEYYVTPGLAGNN